MGTRGSGGTGLGAARMAMFAAAALVAFAVGAGAGKPSSPPPAVDTGTIYYGQLNSDVWSMLPDGSSATDISSVGRASLEKHDGKRWFLTWLPIAGADPYPSGEVRRELYAVTDEGDEVQLTDAPLIEPNFIAPDRTMHTWANDGTIVDGKVSYLGMQWVEDGAGGYVIDETASGLFTLTIEWDRILYTGDDPVLKWEAGLPVVEPYISFNAYETEYGTEPNRDLHTVFSVTYCWSPDGSKVAWLDRNEGTKPMLRWKAIDGSSSKPLVENGYLPRWWGVGGTDGVIAFSPLVLGGGIQTIKPDGNGLTTVVKAATQSKSGVRVNSWPVWSPNGTHLLYSYYVSTTSLKYVIYRVAASGGSSTSLATADTVWVGLDWVK